LALVLQRGQTIVSAEVFVDPAAHTIEGRNWQDLPLPTSLGRKTGPIDAMTCQPQLGQDRRRWSR